MRVFVDFENTLLSQDIKSELFWFNVSSHGFSYLSGKNKPVDIKYLPYMSKTLYILNRFYKDCEIYLISYNRFYDKYLHVAIKELRENFGLKVMDYVYLEHGKNFIFNTLNESSYKKLMEAAGEEEDNAIIASNVMDHAFLNQFKEISLVNNFISSIIGRSVLNLRFIRSTGFMGIFGIFFTNVRIIWPILCIWPIIFESHYQVINLQRLSGVFFSSLGFFSFAHLLRTLFSLQDEREALRKNLYPLCGHDFIFDTDRLEFCWPYLILFFTIGCFSLKFSFIGFIVGVLLSVVYFIFVFSTRFLRWSSLGLSAMILQLLCQHKFAIKILSKIFLK